MVIKNVCFNKDEIFHVSHDDFELGVDVCRRSITHSNNFHSDHDVISSCMGN